ncbi:FAD-dependent oxidoreductase [Mycolicibacterium brumae]|uniref:FAD-binding monooxygenase n=1 Tax=Mycolicibacterium brumae TaxID=85968 RepID=A0A2G5PBN9_9MYCO|nr:FAD-dependent oxidoreductase [Mycolicibacterium brumae]MCV7191509.1 FAD-dependent oxidoreductase [Mycolicibacterium brumae]PIB75687.1 FAD-binding monooxygenase [Mycolicibacterium brumae]RWA16223.1 hypothetical protein MBRU_08935 [Mycolicibacterium brumae DSM 44177]UWW09384.1 FAD-dependent oxidoreductase [Mycolicibacterium brumae]
MRDGTHPVVVVGAGISGLATAVALQRAGLAVTVLERDVASAAASGSGISIWPNALAALDILGLGDAVRAVGGTVSAGAVRWHDGAWVRRPQADLLVRALGEPLVVLRRSALREALSAPLAAGTVRHGAPVTGVAERAGVVEVTLADGRALPAAAVIGADGVASVIARALCGPLPATYTGRTAWRGVADAGMDPELAGETFGMGLQAGHTPLGPDHTYWFATERAPEGDHRPDGELTYLRRRFGGWAEPLPGLLAATDPAAVLRNDLYDRAIAPVWSRGRVTLVGDAAHPMRPHLGQGGCQGLEDAAVLGAFVAAGSDLGAAFAGYAAFRRGRVATVVRTARMVGRASGARPDWLGAAAVRAGGAVPEFILTRQLASIAGRMAFRLP